MGNKSINFLGRGPDLFVRNDDLSQGERFFEMGP